MVSRPFGPFLNYFYKIIPNLITVSFPQSTFNVHGKKTYLQLKPEILQRYNTTVKPVLSDHHSGDMEIAIDRWLLIAE